MIAVITIALLVLHTLASANDRIFEKDISSLIKPKYSIKNMPQLVDPPKRIAGYFKLARTVEAQMFYFFFEAREKRDKAPLVLWTNGGPGCSSELGVFQELMGPYQVDEETLEISENPTGWDTTANMIFIDQPINTGFSFSDSPDDRVYDEKRVARDVIDFLDAFLEVHPDMQGRDFYVSGESYGGHYVPVITWAVYEQQKKAEKALPINLVGLAIGNGMTNFEIQVGAYGDYAYEEGLISKAVRDDIRASIPWCEKALDWCYYSEWRTVCEYAANFCNGLTYGRVMSYHPDMNMYDIRTSCDYELCYNIEWMYKMLNDKQVQKQLGVSKPWEECNYDVYYDLHPDFALIYDQHIPKLLDSGLKILIYAGDKDFICNWLGNKRWVDRLNWSGSKEWSKSGLSEWKVNGVASGEVQKQDGLVFLRVYDAGHMVPMDQPDAAFAMINSFLFDTWPSDVTTTQNTTPEKTTTSNTSRARGVGPRIPKPSINDFVDREALVKQGMTVSEQ